MDMYKLAQEQAKNVEVMVKLLTSINGELRTISKNQEAIFEKLSDIEDSIEALEDFDDEDDLDDDLDFFEPNDDDDDDDYVGCGCDYCLNLYGDDGDDVEEVTDKLDIEEMALESINTLTSQSQLPYRMFNSTFYEYKPNMENPIQFIVNESKRTVAALLKDERGKVIKTGKARCTPADKFSPWIGAAIAAYRLFELEVPKTFVK